MIKQTNRRNNIIKKIKKTIPELRGQCRKIAYHISPQQKLYECRITCYMRRDEDEKAMKMMGKYPRLEKAFINHMEDKLMHTECPEIKPETKEEIWQSICARIRKKRGEDAI